MLAQALPLHVERVLLALDASDFGCELPARLFERCRITIAQRLGPAPEGCATVCRTQRLEQRVVAQPRARDREELRTDRCVRVGQLLWVDERRIAGEIRSHPVGRAICTDGSHRQYLPHREARLGQPVDECTTAAPQRRIERGHG
ncbi:MAG TPA: hypothetical protein VHT52_17120 [Stellaceae bacterium]|nr:hypothetical protein [Stellaceae bacterium]